MAERLLSIVLVIGLLPATVVKADQIGDDRRELMCGAVEENLRATEKRDLTAIRSTIHPESASYTEIEKTAAAMARYDLKFELEECSPIAETEGYLLVRVVQVTRLAEPGPMFADNRITSIWALLEDDGQWKFWEQMILELEFLDGRAPE